MPVNKYTDIMGKLEAARNPSMEQNIQDAIISTESSGRPEAIGDVGAAAGDSRGLMQIQDATARGLYKKGLLPKVWNGKKVKKRDLPSLLLDPEFNKQAGSALFEDNRNILKKKAIREGIEITDNDLQDLTIKAHNQGVSKTIRRDLMNEEKQNPIVQKYLEKVRGSVTPEVQQIPDVTENIPAYADGGTVEEKKYPETYQEMMADLDVRKAQYAEDKRNAEYGDIASGLLGSFGEYGAKKGAADAQAASGMQIKAPEVKIKPTNLVAGLEVPKLGDYLKQTQMMKTLKSLQGSKQQKDFTLGEGQVRYGAKGKVIASGPKKKESPVKTKVIKSMAAGIPVTKLINANTGELIKEFSAAPTKPGEIPLSIDPKSKESKASQEKLKGIGFSISDKDLLKLSQQDIEKNFGAFIRKTTRKIELTREARMAEKQAWAIKEKDEVSDKQLESITALDDIQQMVDRVVELKKKVKLSKGLVGPKVRQVATQIGAEYLGIDPDEDYVRLQALVEKQLSDYIKSASGLTVSDQEATRLSRAIPSMSMPDGQFNSVMKEFQKTLKDVKTTRFKNIKGYQGKFVPNEMVQNREGLIKKVIKKYPKYSREKAIKFLKEKKRW